MEDLFFFFFTNFYKLPSKSVNFLPYQMNVMEDVSATVQLSSLITREYFRNGVKGLYYIIVFKWCHRDCYDDRTNDEESKNGAIT